MVWGYQGVEIFGRAIKKPWVFIWVPYMSPRIFGL